MIYIKNLIIYTKYFGIYSLIQIITIFICSILNLLFLSSAISTIILLIVNILCFMLFGLKMGLNSNKKGLIIGLIVGLSLSCITFFLSVIFYGFSLRINTILYYTILIISSIFGGIIGKNYQSKTNKEG